MAFSNTAPLRRAVEAALPRRPFAISFWDGTTVPATEPDSPTFRLLSPQALAHVVRAPGELGLGRAFVLGLIDADSVEGAIRVIDTFEPSRPSVSQMLALAGGVVRACGLTRLPRPPASELRLTGERHTVGRDRQAVSYHYDAGNDFFKLFLDDSMTYSCGYFRGGAETLADAQRAKLDLVCTKLGLKEGERVLDVGCGWGSFAIHAAKHYGVTVTGVTLSPSQAELAREKVAEAGLSEQIEIHVTDYRELPGASFDAIASIGMSEHVGESQIDRYAQSLFALLRPGGVLLNHAIAALDPEYDSLDDEFSMRYVFPDGEALPLSRVQLALERAGFHIDHVEGFREDYARTLRHWTERLDEHLEQAERLAGVQRTRVWRLYLRAARHGFDTSITAVYQVRARRPG